MIAIDPSLTADESFTRTRITADEGSNWPPQPTIITHTLGGVLADRVRRRLRADENEQVRLTESTTYGGYSEWTQENSTEFTVECAGTAVTFHPQSGTADWRNDAGNSYADSVFARFDAWLAVAERPSELFAQWFAHDDEAGRIVRYRALPDTILTRTAQERHGGVGHLSLTGSGDGYGREWELDLVAKPTSTGFLPILERHTLTYAEGLTITDSVAREVLTVIADDFLPGREPF